MGPVIQRYLQTILPNQADKPDKKLRVPARYDAKFIPPAEMSLSQVAAEHKP